MKQMLYIFGFILLCLAGVAGTLSRPIPETYVGYFTVSQNPFGVAIYQAGRHASTQFIKARTFAAKGSTVTVTAPANITYSRDDIIFDANGTLYTEPKQEEIDYLSNALDKPFVKVATSDRVIPLPSQTIYLVNPQIPGMLEIQLPTEFQLKIDRDQKQISGWTGATIPVIIHDTITI